MDHINKCMGISKVCANNSQLQELSKSWQNNKVSDASPTWVFRSLLVPIPKKVNEICPITRWDHTEISLCLKQIFYQCHLLSLFDVDEGGGGGGKFP